MAALGFVFTYIFNTVTFSNYMKDMYTGKEDPSEMCDEVIGCVTTLYIAGVVGESAEFEMVRYSYDMISFIFFEIMFGSIVSSLMLDAFSSLREEQDGRQEDKENFCYICNVTRETVEKEKEDFQEHIKKHFLWNYIFYIYVLELKDATDYTGL